MVGAPNLHPLAVARQRERFTQRQLAAITGVRHARIHDIEHGHRPSQIEARLLAAALRMPLRDLLPGQSKKEARHGS